MKKRVLIIPIESTSRELDSRILTIISLLQLNKDWHIYMGISKKVKQYALDYFKNNYVLLENSINKGPLLKLYKKENIRVFVLDEEDSIFTKYEEKNMPRHGLSNSAFNYIEKMFVWGEARSQNLKKNHKELVNKKIIIAGNPRFDLSKKEFQEYYNYLNTNSGYILIICAFGIANDTIDYKDELYYWDSDKNHSNWQKANTKMFSLVFDYQKKLMKEYISGIKSLVKQFPNENFIIRPHPVEKVSTYKKFFEGNFNVRVISNGSIQEWLPGSKVFIHNGCTTAIEALCHGIEPISFVPHYKDEFIQYVTHDISEKVYNEKDLRQIFEKKISNQSIFSREKKQKIDYQIKKIIHNYDLDAFYAADFISKEINKINVFTFYKKPTLLHYIKNFLKKIKNIELFFNVKKFLILQKMKKRDFYKTSDLNLDSIRSKFKKLGNIYNKELEFNITNIKKDIYLITDSGKHNNLY